MVKISRSYVNYVGTQFCNVVLKLQGHLDTHIGLSMCQYQQCAKNTWKSIYNWLSVSYYLEYLFIMFILHCTFIIIHIRGVAVYGRGLYVAHDIYLCCL